MQRVSFKNIKGLNLVGCLYESNSCKAVIIAHGFCSNKDKERYVKAAEEMNKAGLGVLRFDFSGSGESANDEITIANQVQDLKSAMRYLKDKSYSRIGVVGASAGGLVALKTGGLESMVLWGPVSKKKDNYADYKFSQEQQAQLQKQGYLIKIKDNKHFRIPQMYIYERENVDPKDFKTGCPILIIHGDKDEFVPVEDSRNLINNITNGELKVIGAGHNLDEDLDTAIELTIDWFRRNL